MNAPVCPNYPPFSLRWLSRLQCPVNQLNDTCPIIGMNQIFKSRLCSGKGSGLQAIHCLQFRCPSVHTCLDIPLKTANVSNLLCQSQPFFAGAQFLFCQLSFADVTGNSRNAHHSANRILNWGNSQGYVDSFPGFGNPEPFQTARCAPPPSRFLKSFSPHPLTQVGGS